MTGMKINIREELHSYSLHEPRTPGWPGYTILPTPSRYHYIYLFIYVKNNTSLLIYSLHRVGYMAPICFWGKVEQIRAVHTQQNIIIMLYQAFPSQLSSNCTLDSPEN